ncbi:DUF4139 domain-containing protein [Winogradskyella sp.]|uniref:DUF4139 domain-containing protein n=1 Tax=Winogradskyella sp. TaxID=1883156 RepID=UPI002615C8B2|nr:mucoidy inhibitor MuiA family protein [Winogradskyella sp.]
MKTLSQFLFILSFVSILHGQQPSTISEVTVYLDGAEVKREATVNLKPGTSELVFNNLSSYIEESSIQVSGLKGASILSINYGINYLSKQKQKDSITALQKGVKEIDKKIQDQKHLISGYEEEISLIQKNKHLGNEAQVVSLEQLKAFATYYRERITQLQSDINRSNLAIEDYGSDRADIINQLNEYNVDDKVQTGEIKIKLNTDQPETLNLNISYNIKNAGWFPIYDLKADKINTPINLEYKAHIYQNSGCDWKDVKLTLSTSDPYTNNERPIVNPKYLNFVSPYSNYQSQRATKSYNYKYNPLVKAVSGIVTSSSDGLPLPGASVIEKGTTNGTQTDFDGRYTLKTSTGNVLVFSYVGMETVEFPIHSSVMNVALNEGNTLDEVVVVGYSNSVSSRPYTTTSVTSEKIIDGLYGSTAGINIRGASTLKSKNNILFIVDGIPVKENAAKKINPDSIESIEVLKDSEATAIYGNRAANGVIIINTGNGSQRRMNELGVIVESGITNTRFEIDKSYSIPSDGDVTVVKIDQFNVPAKYEYFAAPVLNENVFLTAKIANWEQYNLLPAEANVYFEGSYSGKTNINPGATTDSLTISLGVDPNITTKRTQRNDFKKTTFIGSNKVVYKAFEIEVRNNKTSNIRLTLIDRIPITQNRAIKLDDINTGTSDYDKDKGLLKWSITLKPGEKEKVEHSYAIRFPKGKRINL